MLFNKLFLIQITALVVLTKTTNAAEFKGLKSLFEFLSGNMLETKRDNSNDESTEQITSRTIINFSKDEINYQGYSLQIDQLTYGDLNVCSRGCSSLYNITENLPKKLPSTPKKPIKVKCSIGQHNETVLFINSLKEIRNIIKPVGNNTKLTDEGPCSILLFYGRSCYLSVFTSKLFYQFSEKFPHMIFAVIDAFKFHSLSTGWGIISVPTILLFHQGRIVAQFVEKDFKPLNIENFILKHTNLVPEMLTNSSNLINHPFTLEYETDYYLYLAWIFIFVCCCYYFTKSKWYTQIIETLKRNWRESEAQHEHQN